MWTSPDGIMWSRVPHEVAVFGGEDGQQMLGVTAGGPGRGLRWVSIPREASRAKLIRVPAV